MRFAENYDITLFIKFSSRTNFRKPFWDLPDTFWDTPLSLKQKQKQKNRQMIPNSGISFLGKCSFWIPSGFLPDLIQD